VSCFRWGLVVTIGLFISPVPIRSGSLGSEPERLAIYYGYPSLVNGSQGDVEKASSVFSTYDVVVLGDGIEFPDQRADRHPGGDPEEHQKAVQIIAAVHRRNPGTRFFGYICLGEMPSQKREKAVLSLEELEERTRLWKQMGVAGIFVDEAGYDFSVVTRKRQNLAVALIHRLGLSAFMNAYFLEHLFSVEENLPYANGSDKNPEHLPPLLDGRDLFLLESFQVKNGTYESTAAWKTRLSQAIAYRHRHGVHLFSTTTTELHQPFDDEKFTYAWWTARLYGFDGFSWGEPDFAALSNSLPDRRCQMARATLPVVLAPSPVSWDRERLWKRAGNSVFVVNTADHSVRILPLTGSVESKGIAELLRSPQNAGSRITCGGTHE